MDNIQKTWFNSTTKTMVIDPINAAAFAADISNCKLDGSGDEIQQRFDTAKYQACQLHTNNDKISMMVSLLDVCNSGIRN